MYDMSRPEQEFDIPLSNLIHHPPPLKAKGVSKWMGLAHRNRSDFCDLRLRCPSRTPEIARFPRQETAMMHCDLRVRWKVASDLRFRAAISEPKPPSCCRGFLAIWLRQRGNRSRLRLCDFGALSSLAAPKGYQNRWVSNWQVFRVLETSVRYFRKPLRGPPTHGVPKPPSNKKRNSKNPKTPIIPKSKRSFSKSKRSFPKSKRSVFLGNF